MAAYFGIFNPGGGAITAIANEAITAGDCLKLVAVTGVETFRLGVADTAASDIIIGVAEEDVASGAYFQFQPNGLVGSVRAGDTITLGASLTCESGGGAVVTTTVGDYLLGTALQAATDGNRCIYISGGTRRFAATS